MAQNPTAQNSTMPANPPIHDYGLIGDCRTAALISRSGSIDWLCWPRFDSPAIFCSILDRERGGHWRIAPKDVISISRQYVPDTNVLQTTFHCSAGIVTLTDLMPVATEEFKLTTRLPDHEIARQLECREGEVEIEMEFMPRLWYGLQPASMHSVHSLGVQVKIGKGVCWLRSSTQLDIHKNFIRSAFRMRGGDTAQFSLSYTEDAPAVLLPFGGSFKNAVDRSIAFWQQWAARATYKGPYREAVVRSVLALKLLTFAPSGAIIAAATTSLPERIGGSLNWDYRFCWLRDASLTIRALLGLGYWDEASDFLEWMVHATWLTQPELNILYTVYGRFSPKERELTHLSGYNGSRPVRLGNQARNQLQLDVYGEVLDAASQYAFHGGTMDKEMQKTLRSFGKYVVKNWDQPDEGIWEPRDGKSNHTHSRLLCWTALDRLLALGKRGWDLGSDTSSFRHAHRKIQQEIHLNAWNSNVNSYTSVLNGHDADASLLLFPWYGFEKADSHRMKGTYAWVRAQLDAGNQLIYRYRSDQSEGAFAICSFWEAEFLALGGGTFDDSRKLFEHLLSYQNDLGLYAEEIDPQTGAALGNFPQAFTHVGVISAALSLQDRARGTESLPHRPEKAAANGVSQEAVA